jgi:hypothetical protein
MTARRGVSLIYSPDNSVSDAMSKVLDPNRSCSLVTALRVIAEQ